MASILFTAIFSLGWLLAVAIAWNDAAILIRGKLNDVPEAAEGLASRPGFIRLVAGLRLLFALGWIVAVGLGLVLYWFG